MKLILAALCHKAVIDRESNQLSLIDIIDRIQFRIRGTPSFPAGIPFRGDAVAVWQRDEGEAPTRAYTRVRILGPDRAPLGEFISEVDLESADRTRAVGHFDGFRIAGTGRHYIEFAGRTAAQSEFTVGNEVSVDIEVRIEAASVTGEMLAIPA